MSKAGLAYHNKKRKYTDDDIALMEHMRYVEKKSLEEIGERFDVGPRAIETQIRERGTY